MLWYNSVNDLELFLKKDKVMKNLCPVRIINVNNLCDWRSVRNILRNLSNHQIMLSSLCSSVDNTPNIKRLYKQLDSCDSSASILPLSEYLRLYPEQIDTVISKLITREYINFDGKQKLYFLMYNMQEQLAGLDNNDPRKAQSLICLRGNKDEDYLLNVVNENLDKTGFMNEVKGFKYYLMNWENEPVLQTTLLTSNVESYKDKIFSDNIKIIENAFDLLRSRNYIPKQFKYEDAKPEYWEKLLCNIVEYNGFEETCKRFFFISNYDVKAFEKWNSYDDFGKWLLWMWSKLKADSYIYYCANHSNDIDGFVSLLYSHIIDILTSIEFEDIYKERKEILKLLDLQAPKCFWSALNGLSVVERLKVLTNNSNKEKAYIVSQICELDYNRRIEILKILNDVYPDLCYYLDNNIGLRDCLTAEHKDYFDKYRWYKVANSLPISFYNTVQYFAKQKGEGVFSLQARNAVVNKDYEEGAGIVFVDALGIEYMDLIAQKLSYLTYNGYHVRYACGYCNLPTITAINKDFLVEKNVIWQTLELDHMKHCILNYPENIIKELDSIDQIIENIKSFLEDKYNKIIVTSDHGSSRLAVLSRNSDFDNKLIAKEGCIVYKHGRYCDSKSLSDELETAINFNDKLVFADYSRFEQKGSPGIEIHGGASLEEWLVPIIIIEKAALAEKNIRKNVEIILTKSAFVINPKTKYVTIEFYIENFSDPIAVLVHSKKIQCQKILTSGNKQYYSFDYRPFDGEDTVKVDIINDSLNGSFIFKIKKGITQNADFDI